MVAYNLGIPDGPNNPSNDQPKMKTNTDAIQTLISVDHVGFNTNGSAPNGVGGHHLQVSFDGKNTPAAQTDPQSVLYTASGVASTVADMKFRNQNGTFAVNLIRAWAFCTPGGYDPSQQFNAGTIGRNSAGNYTVTLPANVVTGTIFSVIIGFTRNSSPGPGVLATASYNITGAGVFDMLFFGTTGVPLDPFSFSFIVLQL